MTRLIPRHLRALAFTALGMSIATVLIMGWRQLPIRDPDYSLVGPSWLVIPALVLIAVVTDVLGHALWPWLRARVAGSESGVAQVSFASSVRSVFARRWDADQWRFMVVGLVGWYVCYSAFRNLKHAVPFVTDRLWDRELTNFDKTLFLGHKPWVLLHDLFGTSIAAYAFSAIYILWIGFVPVSIWWALVWCRDRALSAWYVTALGFGWALGAFGYFLMPSLGPIYSDPDSFAALPHTRSAWLADQLASDRLAVVPPTGDPHSSHTLQTIAAWPSLHVGIMVIASLIVFSRTRNHLLRMSVLAGLMLTVLATIYLGWHFAADVFGGMALGTMAVWLSARLTGNKMRWMPQVDEPLSHRVDAPTRSDQAPSRQTGSRAE